MKDEDNATNPLIYLRKYLFDTAPLAMFRLLPVFAVLCVLVDVLFRLKPFGWWEDQTLFLNEMEWPLRLVIYFLIVFMALILCDSAESVFDKERQAHRQAFERLPDAETEISQLTDQVARLTRDRDGEIQLKTRVVANNVQKDATIEEAQRIINELQLQLLEVKRQRDDAAQSAEEARAKQAQAETIAKTARLAALEELNRTFTPFAQNLIEFQSLINASIATEKKAATKVALPAPPTNQKSKVASKEAAAPVVKKQNYV